MTIRAHLLAALANGPLSRADLVPLLSTAPALVKSALSNAQASGHIEALSSRGGQAGAADLRQYRITDSGRYFLAKGTARPRREVPDVVASNVAQRKFLAERAKRFAFYAVERDKHVTRQRRAGIPDALIFGALPAEMPGTRGAGA